METQVRDASNDEVIRLFSFDGFSHFDKLCMFSRKSEVDSSVSFC